MRNAVQLLAITAIAIVCTGCQRSYITSDNPRYPLKDSQVSSAKWTNTKTREDSDRNKWNNFATRLRTATQ